MCSKHSHSTSSALVAESMAMAVCQLMLLADSLPAAPAEDFDGRAGRRLARRSNSLLEQSPRPETGWPADSMANHQTMIPEKYSPPLTTKISRLSQITSSMKLATSSPSEKS
jgi:hypothetical protein